MIALDTNVLVRYLTQDDPVQSPRANRFIRSAILNGDRLFIPSVALAEMVWVLQSCHKATRQMIFNLLTEMSNEKQFVFSHETAVNGAIFYYNKTNLDFADLLLFFESRAAGAKQIVSFDRALLGFDPALVREP